MKLITLIVMVCLNSTICISQSQSNDLTQIDSTIMDSDMPTKSKLLFINNCANAKEIAKNDIAKNKAKILLTGGVTPIFYATDNQFEERYQVAFHDYGDLAAKYECMKIYNFEIFQYLSEKYGKSWKKEIRKDTLAFKEWKKLVRKK